MGLMSSPVPVAIALGSNLGDSVATVTAATDAINAIPGITVTARSPLYKTAPIGPPQPDYINACLTAQTTLPPRVLLQTLLDIEHQFGRVRQERWGARSLDLDLLLYSDRTLNLPGLTVPHPRLHHRAFVLIPLTDVASDWVHPQLCQSIEQIAQRYLFEHPSDRRDVVPLAASQAVSQSCIQ